MNVYISDYTIKNGDEMTYADIFNMFSPIIKHKIKHKTEYMFNIDKLIKEKKYFEYIYSHELYLEKITELEPCEVSVYSKSKPKEVPILDNNKKYIVWNFAFMR